MRPIEFRFFVEPSDRPHMLRVGIGGIGTSFYELTEAEAEGLIDALREALDELRATPPPPGA